MGDELTRRTLSFSYIIVRMMTTTMIEGSKHQVNNVTKCDIKYAIRVSRQGKYNNVWESSKHSVLNVTTDLGRCTEKPIT
jgi:hypothetical protein